MRSMLILSLLVCATPALADTITPVDDSYAYETAINTNRDNPGGSTPYGLLIKGQTGNHRISFAEFSLPNVTVTSAVLHMYHVRSFRPGSPAKEDSEYARHGTANLFVAFEPLAGRRVVEVTQRRTAVDFARFLKRLLDEVYPDAPRVVLVTDNLNTHAPGSLYEAFDPAEARRRAERIEWHYTPKHGSWLNLAEVELSVLARQCLDRRIPDRETLAGEVAAWEAKRNAAGVTANWQFTTADARIKLKKLYPTVQLQ